MLVLEARDDAPLPPSIAIHPDNPKYFLFRDRPLALVTASEHYGSVVNRAFDFERYLADAADKHQTLTRTFLLFREQQSLAQSQFADQARVARLRRAVAARWARQGPGRRADL